MGVPWATPLCRTRGDSGIRPKFVLVLMLLFMLVPFLLCRASYPVPSVFHPTP